MKKCALIVIFTMLLTLFTSCLFPPEEELGTPSITYYDVKYEVTGTTTTVDITMENEDGGVSQYSDVSVPWSYEFRRIEDSFVYISAQNQQASGSVIVKIYTDGSVFKSSTSSGAYVIATASGSLP